MSLGNDKFAEGMRRLRRYESRSLVIGEYKRIHGLELDSNKANSIVMSIKQGRELFESSMRTDYMTRPIELYYGMASFARAMTMLAATDLAEGDLAHSHGLKLDGFLVTSESAVQLLDIPLTYTNGAFTQWYTQAQDTFSIRANSSEASWSIGYDVEILKQKITLGELLGLMPDVWKELMMVDGEDRAHFSVTSYQTNILSFDGKASNQQAEACFPGISSGKVTGLNNRNWNANFSELTYFSPQFVQENEDGFNIGSSLVVPPVRDIRLSPLAIYISVAYVMSMLARYRPSIWGAVWNGGVANEMYPLFSQTMHLMQVWFPYMFAENMKNLKAKS